MSCGIVLPFSSGLVARVDSETCALILAIVEGLFSTRGVMAKALTLDGFEHSLPDVRDVQPGSTHH